MSSLYCAKGFLAYETIIGFGKVLPRLLPAAAIVLTQHLNRSMHADDILLFAKYIIAHALVDWILRFWRQEIALPQVPTRSNEGLDTRLMVILVLSSIAAELVQAVLPSYSVFGQFISNAISLTTLWLLASPRLLFEGLCVLGFSRLIRLAQQPPGQDSWKSILELPFAAAGLPLKALDAVPMALDKIIPLDPTITSFLMVFLGFLIGILSVHKRYRKVVSERRPSSQLIVLENSRPVVLQCGRCARLPSDASSDNGSLVEPDLTNLDALMSRARTKSTYMLIASTEENPSNDVSEEKLAPDGTVGRYYRAEDAKSVCVTIAANTKKSVRFATFEEQSFREQYALVARRAALKGFQVTHRNHFQQSPDIMPQMQLEAYCSNFSSAGSEPGLSLADSDAENSQDEMFAVAPSAAAEVPNHPGDEIGSDEEDEIYGMPIEGQETQLEFEAAVMSIWRKTFGGQQQTDIDPNPSWFYELEAGLSDSECSLTYTRDEEEAGTRVHGHARSPSNLHENNNIAPPISNKPSKEKGLGLANFLDLEQEREPVPEPETPDVISTLLLPLTSFRDELEARLQTLDPAQGPEDITFTLTDDEDVELGIRGNLESPPRAWLADGQNRGILERTHTAEEDEVWFASRTIHRELAI
ncbi:hypothetical protein A7U60_g6472 [Sanghuangporus baumii]|uniref:Uncharacterized protein n=1 Tax=Sanghuangporus baumii TaxID=108892 RepID=A0A9Q5N1M1_SANBA|nr:hypothetical protein A7U60_g6472 [Sanghuangporus baumii]